MKYTKHKEPVRVNARISHDANAWLDNYSLETGISKSGLIHMAVSNYIQQHDVMKRMSDMGELVAKLDEIQELIQTQPKEK